MPHATSPRLRLAAAGLLLVGAVAACGGSSATPAASAAATTAPATSMTSEAPGSVAPSAAAGSKVSANTATRAEITAALEAAGVPNPSRWAREVEEYRPYAADDPTLQALQDNLAKYNPDAATLAGILSVLEP